MQASLNQLAEILAERMGRQFDIPFREEVKVMVNYWRARLIVDSLNARPKDRKFFTKWLEFPLIEVPQSEFPGFPADCKILRTKCKVPKTVRANSRLYDFVGKLDRMTPTPLKEPYEIKSLSGGRYTGNLPMTSEKNGYIYVFNTLNMTGLAWQGIPEDVEEFIGCCEECGMDSSCYDEDSAYAVSEDIKQRIIQAILSTELTRIGVSETKAAEVPVTNGQ